MATDPSAIIQGMLQSAGLGRTVSDFQQQDAQTQGQQQRNQIGQMQIAATQVQQQRDNAFHSALGSLANDPSDGNLAKIALQFPEQVDALKKSKALLDEPVLNAHKTYFSGLERVAGANNSKLVTQQLQSMITAEKAQGHDTSEAEDMLSRVNAGDPAAMKQVQAFAKGQLYVIDPTYAAAIDKSAAGENANHYASTGDGTIYDQRSGDITRAGGANKKTFQVPVFDSQGKRIGTQFTDEFGNPVEGGGQASGGGSAAPSGAPAGRTTGGWTPRTRNGGDNPDNAVDSKITGAAQYLGVGPTDDITKLSPLKIAQAMTLSEGGQGSLADRNNNPANLRNGDGSYKKFPTKEAGLNAAAALVARKIRNGQTNVQTLIEGLPTGSPAAQSATGKGYIGPVASGAAGAANIPDSVVGEAYKKYLSPGRANLVQAVIDGRAPAPRPGSKFGESLAEDIARVDPTADATTLPIRQKVRQEFNASGKQGQAMQAYNRFAAHLNSAWALHQQLGGPNLGPLSGIAAGISQSFSPGLVSKYNTEIEGLQGEFQKLTKLGVANEGEANRLIANARAAQSADGRGGALKGMAELVAGAYQPAIQGWHAAFPNKPVPIDVTPGAKAVINNVLHDGKRELHVGSNGAPIAPAHQPRPGFGAPAQQFSHMSASGKFGWNGKQWVPAQ